MWQPIQKSKGLTDSERYLADLGERTFLSLWSYPNLYRRKGQELCDLLVIFENNVIIFSDKDNEFKESVSIEVSWKRWFKKSVWESAEQIYGAERWIKQQPSEIYLDPQCKKKFPFKIHTITTPRFFRIAVTKNSYDVAKQHFGSGSSGSFMLVSNIVGDDHFETPFVIGNINPDKGYIHVFDEFTLDIVLTELDTVYDFVSYLKEKEKVLQQKQFISIAGEEELLAHHLFNIYQQSDPLLVALSKEFDLEEFAGFSISEGVWKRYVSDFRPIIKEANKISYFWDDLIEHFSHHILSGYVAPWTENNITSHEEAIRVLAAEGRLARRFLAKNFLEKINQIQINARSSRVCFSQTHKDTCFILVLFPRNIDESYETYRKTRVELLHLYGLVCKYKFPHLRYIAVIGMEPKLSGLSEEIFVFDIPELSPENAKLVRLVSKEENILSDTQFFATNDFGKRKIGRNDKCPCGSGRKYKKCCLVNSRYGPGTY